MREASAFTAEQYETYHETSAGHYWPRARHRVLLRHLRRVRRSPEAPILDIGCGPGFTVEFLRERGLDVIGCDIGMPQPSSAAVAPYLQLGTDVLALPESLLHRVSTALLLDVLEHLESPAALLRDIVARMPRLNELVVTVPARPEVWTNFDDYYGHQLRYTHADVAELAERAGLKLEYQTYFFHALYPPMRVLAAMRRRRSLLRRGESRQLPDWVHRMLATALVLDERLLPRWLYGTSILAVLRVR